MTLTETMIEHRQMMYEHFGLDVDERSALAQAVDYIIEGGESCEFVRRYARGYAEFAERYAAALTPDPLREAARGEALQTAMDALTTIRDEDYRGNRLTSSWLAEDVLKAIAVTLEDTK